MVMKWDISKKYACHGQVKQRGITTGSGKWKTGNVCVHFVNGKWKLEVFYCTAPNKSVTSTEVNNTNIEGVICKNQLVITLRNKTEASAIQFRPESSATQYTKPMSVLDQLIKDICAGKSAPESHQSPSVVCVTGWQQNGTKTPSKQGPAKDSSFTSVKKKSEEVSLFEDTDDENEFKENQNRGQVSKDKSQKYLQNGMEKARNHLQQIETSGFYSSSSATPRSYGAYSLSSNLKRTPGMMPDPTPPKRPRLSDSINYTWNKSNITTTTPGSNQLPTQPKSLQGFSNLGNTCYMNAILQSLFCLDTFSNDLLFSNTRVMKTLHSQSLYSALYKLLRSRSKTLPEHVRRDMLRNVKSAISTTAKRFSGYQQHDAHEFLGQVLDQLKEEVTKVSSSTPSPHREGSDGDTQYTNPTVQNFEMEVLHSITCLNCREVVTKAEQFNDLSVDMPRRRKNGDPSSIQNALDLFFRSEAIEYTCEKCGSNKSEVSHKFSRLPRVLVLHLKRYNFDQSIINTKTAQSISITRFLSLEGHCEENTYPPYPALLNSPEQYKTPDKSLTSAESVPRRCLQLGESFRFKKTRPVEEDEKEDVSTSTPYKKAKIFDLGEDHNIKADMPLLIEDGPDEEEDKDLARALELSLQEANDRTQNYVDETKESELQKVLEMSRVEIDKSTQFDHDYGKTIQNMSEEEQMRLAIEQSLMETSHVSRTDFTQEIKPINTEHTDEAIDDTQVDKPICQTNTTDNNVCRTTSVKKPTEDASSQTAQSCVKKEKTTRTSLSSGKPLQKSPLCVRKLGNGQENTSSDFPVKGRVSDAMLDVIAEERDTESVGPDSDLSLPEKQRDDSQEFSVSGDKCIDLTSPDPCVSDSSSKFLPVNERITTKSTKTCLFGKEDLSKPDSPWNALGEKRIRSELENSTEDLDEKQTKSTIDKMSENVADINTAIDLEYQCTEVKTDGSKPDNSRLCGVQDDDTGHSAISRLDQGSDKSEGDAQVSNGDQEFASLLCEDEDDFQLMLLEDKENALPEHRPVQTQSEEDTQPYPDLPVVENEKGDLPYSYKLVSIVNHQGSTSVAGHYVTDVYDLKKGAWFSCDDSNVTKSTEAEVRSKRERSGYIFFYLSKEIYEDLKDDYAVKNRNRKQ